MEQRDKEYIGDGVYVGHDGYYLWLTTEDGIRVTNGIALEPPVMARLLDYWGRLLDYRKRLMVTAEPSPEKPGGGA